MKIFQKEELGLLWPFYLCSLIEISFLVWVWFYVIYFFELNLSFFQISALMAAWSLSQLVFEVPTGAVADIFGRKFSVILGNVIYSLGVILIFFARDFWVLFLLFCMIGLGMSLTYGADQALVVDFLKSRKRDNLVHDFYIKMTSLVSLGAIFSGIIGALSVKYFGLGSIWIVTGISALISVVIYSLFVKENFRRRKIKVLEYFKQTISYSKAAIKYSLNHEVLLLMVLATFFVAIFTRMSGMMVWQPLFIDVSFKVHWIGYLQSVAGLVAVAVPFFSKPLLRLIRREKSYLALMFFIDFLFTAIVFFVVNWQAAVFVFLLGSIPWGLSQPVLGKFFQHHTPSEHRASITSFDSMVASLGAIIGLLSAGCLLDLFGPKTTIFISSFLLLPVIFFYYRIKR